MSVLSMPSRQRRRLATVAAAALAFAGLAIAPPAAQAAPGDTAAVATVAPGSVNAGSTTEFTVRVTGGNLVGNVASRVEIDVPTGFDNVDVVAGSFTKSAGLDWSQTITGANPSTLVFTQSNASRGLASSDWLQVRVTARAVGSGDHAWTTRAYKGTTNTSNALPVLASPTVSISGIPQTITFAPLDDRTWGAADFDVSATSTGTVNPITFSASGDCTVTGTTVHLLRAGSCTITARQAGGNGYLAAADEDQSFTIHKAAQSISFAAIPDKTYGDADIPLGATASSGLPVSYDLSGSCELNGGSVHLTGAGACAVTASQPGDGNFLAASSVTRSFGIAKASATVNLSDLSHAYDGTGHAVTVTTNPAGLAVDVTYTRNGQPVPSPTDAGDYGVTATVNDSNYTGTQSGTLSIAKAPLTGHFTAADKTYDGTTDATVTGRDLTGTFGTDDVTLTGGTASFDTADAGTGKTVTLTGATLGGAAAANYTLTGVQTTTADVTPRMTTAVLAASDKEYDGTVATVDGGVSATLDGILGSDTSDVGVAIDTSWFDGTDVGAHTVTATVHLTGPAAGNYVLQETSISDTAAISHRLVTGTFTVQDKTYDGDTTATVLGSGLDRAVAGDEVSLVVSGAHFVDRNVGTGKTVTADFALAGSRASQYQLTLASGSTTADITAKTVTGSFTAADKVYDGTTAATITGGSVTGAVGDDDVDLDTSAATATFADKDVDDDKTVTGTGFALLGADSGNYALDPDQPWTTTADITAKSLSATISADDKVYDGTTSAATHPSLSGVVEGDTVNVHSTGTFADKNVGQDKTVTADITIDGPDAGNYTVNGTATDRADITAKQLSGSFTAADKVWDGTTAASITGRYLSGVVGNDDVELAGGTASFDNAHVGTGKTVTGNGFSLSGADRGNYELAPGPWTTTAAITPLYSGTGFYKPVDMSTSLTRVWNTIKGGQTVPLKFEIVNANSGVEQTELSVFGSDAAAQARAFKVTPVSCISGASEVTAVDLTTTGGTSLRYDSTAGQFIQNWKTPTGAGACYAVTVQTVDGSTVGPAYFQIKK